MTVAGLRKDNSVTRFCPLLKGCDFLKVPVNEVKVGR